MRAKVIYTASFEKEFKKLSSKYPSVKSDVLVLVESLVENPVQGVALGNNCYKIRLAITSKGKGKSAGARVITLVKLSDNHVFLITIYDKSAKETISDKALNEMIKSFLK